MGGACLPAPELLGLRLAMDADRLRLGGLVERVLAAMGPPATGRRVAILELALEPGADDVRGVAVLSLIAGQNRFTPAGRNRPKPLGPAE